MIDGLPGGMFGTLVCRALNHLIAGERWAGERLRAFAGQGVRFVGGPLSLELEIDGAGCFSERRPADGTAPAVTIELPADVGLRFFSGRDAVFAGARLSGSADLAETLGFVFRNLRWDVEDDLASLVGDLPARRLLRTGEAIVGWQKAVAGRLAANVAEYLEGEAGILPGRDEFAAFSAEAGGLCAALDALERRIASKC